MEKYFTNYSEAVAKAAELRQNHEEGLIVSVADAIGYATGVISEAYDKKQMTSNDIYEGNYTGGCCVVFEGDLSICRITNNKSNWGKVCITHIEKYLEKKGLIVRQHGNDLLLFRTASGEKIGSWAQAANQQGMYETVVHVSIGMDKDTIERVCVKNGKQVGIGLGELGITAQEIIAHLEERNII